MSHVEAIQKNHDVLQRCTTINLYVIDYLRAEDVLDEAQEHELKTEKNLLKQRILLFQWLKEGSSQKYESFLQVMKDTEQEHVANHLTGSTKEDQLPLSDARYERLVKIRNKMAHVTQVDNEVIAELRRRMTISMTDADEIRVENADYAKISKLISAIMRRSNHSYNSFQVVLRKTLQTAAANFLSEGEMLAVHINNNRPDLDGILASTLNKVVQNNSEGDKDTRELLAEMNGIGVNLVKAIPEQSIVIFIYCKTVQNAVKFSQLFNSGRLQYILDGILNRLLLTIEPRNKETLDSRLILEDDDIISLEEFTGIEASIEQQKLEKERNAWCIKKEQLLEQIQELQQLLVSCPSKTVGLVEKFVPMDLGVVDVITKYMKHELEKIEAELKECSGSIDPSKDKPGFIIRRNETGVVKALKDLTKLTDSVFTYDHAIDRPGIPAYFYSMQGKDILRGIQINRKVSIQLHNTQSQPKPQVVGDDGSEICRLEVRPGKFMILMRGDITKCSTDGIVNSTNEDLKHLGGVSAAIAKAAGSELADDCWTHTKLDGRLLPGEACVTGAGKLPCKKVIHAVGPRWSGGNADEENILAMAVDSSLNAANEEGLESIAMPLISTGIFGFPLDLATDIIVVAVKNYFVDNSSTTVREVFFVANDLRAVDSLERKLRTIQVDDPHEAPETKKEDSAGSMVRTIIMADPRQQSQEQHEERHPQQFSRIILSIYALSTKAIDDVLKDIDDVIKQYIVDKVLDSSQDQESIARLSPEQVKRIKDMAYIFPVQIEVETGRLKGIRIRGSLSEVTSVIDQIHNIFKEAHKKEIKKKEEKWIAKVAQWEYEDESDFEKYPDEINAIIERAYRDRMPHAEWTEENAKYRLNFQTMFEEFITRSGALPVKVRRVYIAEGATIVVSNIPEDMSECTLQMIIGNKRIIGEGEVTNIVYGKGQRSAVITLSDPEVAEELIERGSIVYKNHTLAISRPSVRKADKGLKEPTHTISGEGKHETPGKYAAPHEDASSKDVTIDVSNIPEDMEEDILKMIIESKRLGGGGEVKKIVFEQGQGSAVITLSDPEVVKRLLHQESLSFKVSRLMITRHIEEDIIQKPFPLRKRTNVSSREKEPPSISDRTIKVSCIPSDVNKETLKMIFESRRNSGGEIDSIVYNQGQGTAVITFKNQEVATSFLEKDIVQFKGHCFWITKHEDQAAGAVDDEDSDDDDCF